MWWCCFRVEEATEGSVFVVADVRGFTFDKNTDSVPHSRAFTLYETSASACWLENINNSWIKSVRSCKQSTGNKLRICTYESISLVYYNVTLTDVIDAFYTWSFEAISFCLSYLLKAFSCKQTKLLAYYWHTALDISLLVKPRAISPNIITLAYFPVLCIFAL